MQRRILGRRTFLASATAGAAAVATAGACSRPSGEQSPAPTPAIGHPEAPDLPSTIDFVPNTISPAAQDAMRRLNAVDWETRRAPAPDDLAGWQRARDAQLAQVLRYAGSEFYAMPSYRRLLTEYATLETRTGELCDCWRCRPARREHVLSTIERE